MAQSFAMECPATPERVDQCPATPDFVRRRIKSPENTSSSDESTFLNNSRTATGSPPPNCAICLGKCKNKCFTDSCLHQFCFKCLLEWSKVKAECPLCKQAFKSIIHNVKSDDQFEEYLVQSPPNTFQISDFSRPMRAHIQIPNRGFFSAAMHPPSNNINQLRSNIPSTTRFRRYIYDGGLYATPLPDVTGRFRECSARFYRENISQVHRLMPWLNRELVCLLNQTHYETSTVLCMIHDLLTIFNINSPDFRRRVLPYLGNHTTHFIHEFLNFARSPFDMIGYDREVRYAINPNDEEVIINGTSSSSDSDDIAEVSTGQQISSGSLYNRRQRNNNGSITIEAMNNPNSTVSTVHIIIGDGDSNGSNNSNISASNIGNQTSQLTAINLSTNNNSSIIPNNVIGNQISEVRILNDTPIEIAEANQTSHQNNDDRISLHSSASSDTCEFVLERKPPHLRTPEMVSLDSDSDSDVVFISEQKPTEENTSNAPAPGTSGVSFRVGRQTKLKNSRMRNIRGIFTPTSDVDHSSDSDFKPPVETRSSRPKKLRTRQSARNSKDKSEPSTSSGITGSGKPMSLLYSASSSRSKRKKRNNSKSESSGNRNRPCGGRGYKTIYESSSTSESELSRNESDDDDDDHKSSSSDEENKLEKKPSTASSSSNTSDSTRSSSSSSNKSNDNKKHKNKNIDQNNKSNNIEKITTRRSTRSSSSSSKSSFSTTEENRSRSSSSSSSTSSSSNSSSSSSNSTSGSSSKSSTTISSDTTTDSSKSSIKKHKSIRKSVKHDKHRSSKKHNKLDTKSKINKVHSMRHKKKDQSSSSKSKKDSKKNKRTKNVRVKLNGSIIKKEHRNKNKKRKRKSSNMKSQRSTAEFSVSDVEPLAKHVKICKNELVSSENEQEHSETNNIENESYLQTDYQQEQPQQHEQQQFEQGTDTEQQFPNSILLCFSNDVQMPMNLSTTEQIQIEPLPSPLLHNNAQQETHLLAEGHN